MTILDTIYTFKAAGRSEFTAAAYLAAVKDTAAKVLGRALEIIPSEREGDAFHTDLNDILIDVALCDDASVREVLAFSPNLMEVSLSDLREAIALAETTPNKVVATADAMGAIAYRAFEMDLWDAIWPLYKARFKGTTETWTKFFTDHDEVEK